MRILFVVKEFLPKPTPNGLCVMNIRNALFTYGVYSDVIMVGNQDGLYCSDEMGKIYSLKTDVSFEKKHEKVFNYIKTRIPMLFTWPIPSYSRVRKYRDLITETNEENHYDAIIGTMFPPDVCLACSKFEHFIMYELDSMVNNPMYKIGIKKYLHTRLTRLEKKLFCRAELIIHLNNNRMFYNKDKYERYFDKFVYSDIPNLVPDNQVSSIKNAVETISNIDDDQLLLVYSGYLSKDFRAPTRLIEIVERLAEIKDIKCLFFSRGDCEDELREAELRTGGIIKRMGYVTQNELKKYLARADFLLDIGNNLSGEDYSVPSKVFSYMSEGKPIIHMNGVNDSAIQYLEKYGLALMVNKDVDDEESVNEIVHFIEENKGKHVVYSEVRQLFPQNTPEYTANLIIDQIKNR